MLVKKLKKTLIRLYLKNYFELFKAIKMSDSLDKQVEPLMLTKKYNFLYKTFISNCEIPSFTYVTKQNVFVEQIFYMKKTKLQTQRSLNYPAI